MELDYIRTTDTKFILILFAALFLICKTIHALIIRPHFTSPLLKVPGPRGSPWSLSYLLRGEDVNVMNRDPSEVHREWTEKYGNVIRVIGPLGRETLLLSSVSAIQQVYVSDWVDHQRPEFIRKYTGLVAGFGLLTNHGDEHRAMRRFMNTAFSLQSIYAQIDMYYKPIYGMIEVMSSQLGDSGKEGKVIGVFETINRATLDIICATAFGHNSDAVHNANDELVEAYHAFTQQNPNKLGPIMLALSMPGGKRFIRSKWSDLNRPWMEKLPFMSTSVVFLRELHRIKRFATSLVAERIAEAGGKEKKDSALPDKKDVMSILIQARLREEGEDGYRMTDSEMVEQVLTFLGAGHETTSSGISWTLWLLATHQDIQTKLREEVAPIIAESPSPDYKMLSGMTYLEYVVMESLRLFPPVQMTIRQAGKSEYIDGHWVPKGTWLLTPVSIVNSHKAYWGEDAEEFRPERWMSLPKTKNANFFQTFSVGPHHCIGKTMGISEMKAMVAVLISKFHFEPAHDGQTPKVTRLLTMKPSDNLPLRVRAI